MRIDSETLEKARSARDSGGARRRSGLRRRVRNHFYLV